MQNNAEQNSIRSHDAQSKILEQVKTQLIEHKIEESKAQKCHFELGVTLSMVNFNAKMSDMQAKSFASMYILTINSRGGVDFMQHMQFATYVNSCQFETYI